MARSAPCGTRGLGSCAIAATLAADSIARSNSTGHADYDRAMLALLLAAALSAHAVPEHLAPVVFRGRVVRAEDGSPVAGARAEVGAFEGARKAKQIEQFRDQDVDFKHLPPLPPLPGTTTDTDGRFRIELDPALRPWVLVTARGLGVGASDWSAARTGKEIVFALERTARLELDVALEPDGPPGMSELTARVDASLYATSSPPWLYVFGPQTHLEFTARFDPHSSFVLDGLPSRVPLDLHVLIDGRPVLPREQGTLVLAPGEVRRIPWPEPATAAGRLRVDVRDERGEPVAGVPVASWRADQSRGSSEHVTTDATGAARRGGLLAGLYIVDLGRDLCATSRAVRVGYGDEVVATLLAEPARVLTGSIVGADGAPIVGAVVGFTREGADEFEIGDESDADGHFELPGIPREGRGTLRVSHASISGDVISLAAPTAEAGPAQIRLPALAKLRVRVVDAAGAAVAASIRHNPRRVLVLTTSSTEETEATASLTPGPRRVSAVTIDGRIASAVVDIGAQSEVELRVATAGFVRLRHRGDEEYVSVAIEDEAGLALGLEPVRNAIDTVVLLPPGTWIARAWGRAPQRVRVEAGVETLVQL